MAKKGTIQLPVQILNWSSIPNKPKLRKIFFQFNVKIGNSGNKTFSLVAYPAYRINGKWKIGKKILMTVKKDTKTHELKLPLTLGNLELKHKDIKNKFSLHARTKMEFTPHFYKANPHAEYTVTDGTATAVTLTAKPSPPAPPAE